MFNKKDKVIKELVIANNINLVLVAVLCLIIIVKET